MNKLEDRMEQLAERLEEGGKRNMRGGPRNWGKYERCFAAKFRAAGSMELSIAKLIRKELEAHRSGTMIYAKRLNSAQRRALEKMEAMTGLEPIGQDDLDAGRATFPEVWNSNVRLLEMMMADVTNIDLRGTGV